MNLFVSKKNPAWLVASPYLSETNRFRPNEMMRHGGPDLNVKQARSSPCGRARSLWPAQRSRRSEIRPDWEPGLGAACRVASRIRARARVLSNKKLSKVCPHVWQHWMSRVALVSIETVGPTLGDRTGVPGVAGAACANTGSSVSSLQIGFRRVLCT